jgi:hypothetical protein
MSRDEFDKMFDAEMVREFRNQFTELQLQKQSESYENNPESKWLMEFSTALGEQGIVFYRKEEDVIHVQLVTEFKDREKVESIYLSEIEEYMSINVPAEAVAAAIRAGLLSSVFKFWRKAEEDEQD